MYHASTWLRLHTTSMFWRKNVNISFPFHVEQAGGGERVEKIRLHNSNPLSILHLLERLRRWLVISDESFKEHDGRPQNYNNLSEYHC